MLVTQINGLAALLYIVYMIVVVVAASYISYWRGREDERQSYRASRPLKVYKTPRTIPRRGLPNARQAKVYRMPRHHKMSR